MAQAGLHRGTLPATLKTVLLGGAPVTADFLRTLRSWVAPGTRVLVLYGMTEAGPVCAVPAEAKIAYDGDGDLVGQALDGVRLELADRDPDTGIGEVVVHSPSLYTGYLGQTERQPDKGLETGDLGRLVEIDQREMLVLLGRKKDMIIRNGVNIYPMSFEANLRAMTDTAGRPLLRECAMIGLWNAARQDEDVVLCVQPAAGVEADPARVNKEAARICGTDAKPDNILVVSPIPVTGRQNKVDKQALRKAAAARLSMPAEHGDSR